ncbi:hypothetical protein PF005_g7203 [Phytophthora fragariae]|uniref:Uncharacterized protein n=2 Tax=Phytophthora TaxID=4783 RepID=A0A6A3YPD4_9STRA|nr:hypothetical protein PF003_g39319 [Phytophthora fragariae]KAE9007511.1 hypothetical protein PR002_g16176 [Phytophthora rubi]KAE8942334.1 hypothetical protein PF009_g7905 [Phytophthora fragariae]KAE9009015.1 hypothetical protein PR001_g16552 [Phytophthora rubi]KAE9019846.1 hypothetical protein PF011_g5675 [Phytophthora fragariae]
MHSTLRSIAQLGQATAPSFFSVCFVVAAAASVRFLAHHFPCVIHILIRCLR